MKKLLLLLLIIVIASTAKQSLAQTNVSGGIYANTTWTLANSPYIVVDTIIVFPGVTLTIEPGVVVKFADNKYLEVRQATLVANGTLTDSITFTSNSSSPTPGIWKKIWLHEYPDSIRSTFNYCKFYYATTAIEQLGMVAPGELTIKNSVFKYNINTYSTYYAIVDSCIFINNTNGIGNQGTGTISNCIASYNQIGMNNMGGANVIITNCTINSNQTGVSGTYIWFDHCVIDSNSIKGISAGNLNYVGNCEIKYNGIGLQTSGVETASSGNVIENNNIGIKLTFANSGGFYCNKICNNTTYDLQYAYSGDVDLPYNYWCTPDSISTTLRIYDGYDNISLGRVNFMPLDVNNCYLTGCNLVLTPHITNATCDTCHNGSASITITNGFAPYSYTWYTTPVQTTQTATGLASGTYTVCVTDGHGCTACNYNVFVDSTNCMGFGLTISSTNASCSACSDGTATAHVTGSAPFNYVWYASPIQNTQTATGLATGSYAVCVTDAYGCSACDTATIGIGSCSAYYVINANAAPHTYDLVNMASGTPPLTYDWNWGDGSPHDTAAYPSHTYAGAGTYNICLGITDSTGCTANYCHGFYLLSPLSQVYVNVIPPTTTGINEAANAKAFSIYPNPANSTLTIQSKEAIENITIRSIDGRIVKSLVPPKADFATLNIEELSSGIYFIEVNKSSRQRFIKQ